MDFNGENEKEGGAGKMMDIRVYQMNLDRDENGNYSILIERDAQMKRLLEEAE